GRRPSRSRTLYAPRRVLTGARPAVLSRALSGARMQNSRIVGTGTYLPERVVTNDDLVKELGIETSDAWIRERTGIGQRRIASPNEATSDMAAAASKKALKMAGIRPEDVDMIVCGTVTPDMPFPSAATL